MLISKLREFKKILIVGYGVEGKSTHAFLQKYHPTAQVTIVDKRDGKDYLDNQHDYDLAIKTPSVFSKEIHIPYTTQTNIFFANTMQKKIGITGSKGKSSTCTLLHSVLSKGGLPVKLLGNIGYPMLDYFLGDMHDEDIFIIELSSYQLTDCQFSPHIACFLNIFSDHITQHGSFQEYFNAKATIAKYSSASDFFVYNGTFPDIAELAAMTKAHAIDFTRTSQPVLQHTQLSDDSIKAAYEIARILHVPNNVIAECVARFSGLPHRLQLVGEYRGITFINDSSATTPEAAAFAITQLKKITTILLGGLNRQLQTRQIIEAAKKKHVKQFILFPDVQEMLKQQLLQAGILERNIFFANDMQEAVSICFANSMPGDVCLLSPGFASYNQYQNFPARGEDFIRLVQQNALQ